MGKITFGIIGMGVGITLAVYSYSIINKFTGKIRIAENVLGSGETYDVVRILGVIITFVSMFVMFGWANFIYDLIVGALSGMFSEPSIK